MRFSILLIVFFIQFNFGFSQCNVVSTAIGSSVSCNGDCDGTITFIYQNTGAPGAPYIIALQNQTTGQWISTTTYTSESQTILFENLCPGNYFINVQGSSCQSFATAVVSEPSPLNVYANASNPAPGQNNGFVNLVAQGGVTPYTYSINGTTYQTSATFSGLAPGSYTGYVQDANGCIESTTFQINNTGLCNMVITANATMASCSCDATVYYYFTGSMLQPPYSLTLENAYGQVIQQQNSNGLQGTFNQVCAGVYEVTVTAGNGCSASYSITVGNLPPPVITNVITTDSPWGTSAGSAEVIVNGGTAPYSYSLDGTNYQSSNIFNGLAPGFYILNVEDANGCTAIYCFIIQETQACGVVITSNPTPVSCFGSSSGSITYTYTNANGPVSVVLQNTNGATIQSQTSANNAGQGVFNTLPAGTYTVLITDATGCSFSNTVIVGGPTSGLLLTANTTPSSSGMNNGTITAIASGGTAPYTYSINSPGNWQSSSTFNGLAPGVYIIWAQDANGCTSVYTVQLTQIINCAQAINATSTSVSCAGSNDGIVNFVYTSSGTGAPYTISLMNSNQTIQSQTSSNTAGSGSFTNVSSGVYMVQLVGANGCVSNTQVYVDQPNPLQITNVNVTDATSGNSDGSAIVSVVGGTAPYTYTLNNGTPGTSNILTGLAAGVQILTVTDANGCSTIYCFIVNETVGCQNLIITATQSQQITCYGSCNGGLVWTYTSSGNPGLYSVTVNQNGNNISTTTYTAPSFQGSLSNLCAGQYAITVTDPSGCTATYNLTINQPQQITINAISSNASSGSANGSITVNATGGTGTYLYSLDALTWQNSNVFNGLNSGVYVVYVQDQNNCTGIYTAMVGSNANCYITVTASQGVSNSCPGSCDETINYAFAATNGVGPFVVTLSDQNGNVLTQTLTNSNATGQFTGLCSGVYTVTVTSSNGCYGIYTVLVNTPDFMTISANTTDPTPGLSDGAFTLDVTGGTPGYEYSIDDQLTWTSNNSFTGLGAGVYLAYTRDANTCTVVTAVKLGQSVTDLSEIEEGLSVYPNPSSSAIFIESENIELISVSDINGKIIKIQPLKLTNGYMLNLTEVESGIYFIELNRNGVRILKRVIKD